MLRNWRAWILLVLLVGPVLVYVGFGTLWLLERGRIWLVVAGLVWLAMGLVFSWLAARWTNSQQPVMPPIDWDAPHTFSRVDRDAWAIVEEEAEKGESVSLQTLTEFDIYMQTGRRLARRLVEHYHPLSEAPIDHVPVVELMAALELAAEDLGQLCRQVPGGDMVTPGHWKQAVKVSKYIQRANDLYSFLLPIFNPVTGLVRLGTQQWISRPAWKNMQENLLHWFFRAYINRLGTHLIELYSGRLAIGADQYRKLTRRLGRDAPAAAGGMPALRVAVAGAVDAGKTRLIERLEEARTGDLTLLKARLAGAGIEGGALEHLRTARWEEIPGYTVSTAGESARDRASRRDAVAQAVEADLLILVIDARRDTGAADAAFAMTWDRWFIEHPQVELPPALAVLTGLDDPSLGGAWNPPYNWETGQGPREAGARVRLTALRTSLPPSILEIVPIGLPEKSPFGLVEHLLPELIALFHRAERAALIRHLQRIAHRSKARRLVSQVGEHGKWFWNSLRTGKRVPEGSGKTP